MRNLILFVVCMMLGGCATQAIAPVPVTVAGQTKTYVTGKIPIGVLGDELTIVDRYDEKGNLVHASETSTTGTVHDAAKALAGSAALGTVAAPVETPIINAIEGK
jgi:hypothetical protein